MKHVHYDEVKARPVETDGAEGVSVRWLVSTEDGAPNFCMRRFEVQPGGHTPLHTHAWEHEVYILQGEGTVMGEAGPAAFRAGDVVYVPPGEKHSFAADRGGEVAFLCLVPRGAAGCGSADERS